MVVPLFLYPSFIKIKKVLYSFYMKNTRLNDFKYYLKGLFDVFFVFFKIGSVTFGGGLAMLPILEEELSIKRKWTNREELLDYFAIGQATPGIIAVNVATFVGFKRHREIGGFFGTLGMVAPSIIIITIIAAFMSNFTENEIAQKALTGINIAVAAILAKVSFTFAKSALKKVFQGIVAVTAFVLVFAFNIQTIWIILGAFVIGFCIHFTSSIRKGRSMDKEGSK